MKHLRKHVSNTNIEHIEKAKKIYENIPIPPELDQVVQNAIQEGLQREEPQPQKHRRKVLSQKHFLRNLTAAAATVTLCFGITVNTNTAFAAAVSELPIIGSIARVLTVSAYIQKEDTTTISVEVPGLEYTAPGHMDISFINDFNNAAQEIADHYTARAQQEIADYKKAFFATGGTEEEWAQHDIDVNVQYEIKSQTPTTLSLVLTAYQSWYNYSEEQYFFNLDLQQEKVITLKDILGDDYIQIANTSIKAQMAEQMASDEAITYWTEDGEIPEEAFQTITDDTHFYINETGAPVIVFEKYEVAPGYMGSPEFVIPLP